MTQSKHHTVELSQNIHFQKKEWQVNRITWIAMSVFLLAAFLGLVGDGPLSKIQSPSNDGAFEISYNQFIHKNSPEKVMISMSKPNNITEISVDKDFLEHNKIISITPKTDTVHIEEDQIVYSFFMKQPLNPFIVTFGFEPQQIGKNTSRIGVKGKDLFTINQFVYP